MAACQRAPGVERLGQAGVLLLERIELLDLLGQPSTWPGGSVLLAQLLDLGERAEDLGDRSGATGEGRLDGRDREWMPRRSS